MEKSERTHFDSEDLHRGERGELFGALSPRLPGYPIRMLDRILDVSDEGGEYGKGYAVAEFDVKKDAWFFETHFAGDPVMPGCLGVDGLWQLLGFYLAWMGFEGKGRAFGVGEVKFKNQVLPDVKLLRFRIDIRRLVSRPMVLGIARGLLEIDGEFGTSAQDLRVGLLPV